MGRLFARDAFEPVRDVGPNRPGRTRSRLSAATWNDNRPWQLSSLFTRGSVPIYRTHPGLRMPLPIDYCFVVHA